MTDEEKRKAAEAAAAAESSAKAEADKAAAAAKEAAEKAAADAAKAKELEDAKKEATEAKAAAAKAQKDLVLSKYPAAKDHQADIDANVKKGMSEEDATILALGKAGKLPVLAAAGAGAHQGAGGSAATTIPMEGTERKDPKKMTREELRASMEAAVSEGSIALTS